MDLAETHAPPAAVVAPASTAPLVAARRHPAASLAGPFAAIGLAGGGLTGSITHDGTYTIAFALVTAVSASVLGAYLTHSKRRLGCITTTRLFFGALLAGTINGALLLIPTFFPLGSVAGALVGCFFAIPFIPALALVTRWGDDVGLARAGSIVDGAYRRGPVAATAMSIGLATLFVFFGRWHPSDVAVMRVCAGLTAGVLAFVVASDVRARALARRMAVNIGRPDGQRWPSKTSLEFGVGADLLVEGPTPNLPYRATTTVTRVCGGDPYTAHGLLRPPLIRHSLALIVALLTLVAHALR